MPNPLSYELEEAGKRLAGIVNGYIAFMQPWELRNSVLAVKLEDGSTDGTIYDTMADAKRHSDDTRCFYFHFKGNLGGINPREASIVIDFHREARKAGLPQADPNGREVSPILSTHGHDVYSRIHRASQN